MLNVYAQTNIYNIYNSTVTINNTVQKTNTVRHIKQSNPIVINSTEKTNVFVLTPEIVQKIQWEGMLEQRRNVAFSSYLNKRF